MIAQAGDDPKAPGKPAPGQPAPGSPGPKAPPAEKDADPPLDEAAQKAHDESVAFWVKRLRGEKNREQVRLQIIELGNQKKRDGRDALILFATGNSNQEFVKHAFDALAVIKGKTVVEFLCGKEALRSRDFFVQVAAADALTDTADRRAVGPLVEVLDGKTTKIEVQASCLRALGTCGKTEPAAAAALHRYCEHKADTVRAGALEAIGRLATDEVIVLLARHLKDDKNTRCRAAAATGLGRTGRKEAVEPLRAAKDDESLTVKTAVSEALSALGTTSAGK